MKEYRAEVAPPLVVDTALRRVLDANVGAMMEQRVPGWNRRRALDRQPPR